MGPQKVRSETPTSIAANNMLSQWGLLQLFKIATYTIPTEYLDENRSYTIAPTKGMVRSGSTLSGVPEVGQS